MNYSDRIKILEDYIKSTLGFKVIFFADDLPNDVAGRCYYNEKTIKINEPSAKDALFTLLHEAGHAYSYIKYWTKLRQPQPAVDKREQYAYFYGFGISKILNLGITKDEWKEMELVK